MEKNSDTIAIYSRKSRFTGKGESIGNQVDMCRAYIRTAFGEAYADQAAVFEDEGFSGGNLNRPDFKRMMQAARAHQFRAVVVYRLDRISRSISDFSALIEELGRLGIDFVSIRESFDTSSPMGRAMMYIASVSSQLERETIAERIRDNMHELAKTGRWLGGVTPTGYTSEAVETVTVDGKAVNASEDHTAITGWTELEVEGIKKLAVTVELPASAGNEFMKKSGEAKISVRIGQGNASDEELDNAFSKES